MGAPVRAIEYIRYLMNFSEYSANFTENIFLFPTDKDLEYKTVTPFESVEGHYCCKWDPNLVKSVTKMRPHPKLVSSLTPLTPLGSLCTDVKVRVRTGSLRV